MSNQAPVSFEEFKLYYESTEKVTERRLAMNRWNYSVMAATLIGIGGILGWSMSRPTFIFTGICGVIVLSVMAFLLCTYWIRQIDDFKALNAAKFKVLSDMAPLVVFDGESGSLGARSYRPFDFEWEELSQKNALTSISGGRLSTLLVLRSSGAEYFIPKAFRILFLLVILAMTIFTIISWGTVTHHISPFDVVQTKGK